MGNNVKGIFGKPASGAKPIKAVQAKKSGSGAPTWTGRMGNPLKGK